MIDDDIEIFWTKFCDVRVGNSVYLGVLQTRVFIFAIMYPFGRNDVAEEIVLWFLGIVEEFHSNPMEICLLNLHNVVITNDLGRYR